MARWTLVVPGVLALASCGGGETNFHRQPPTPPPPSGAWFGSATLASGEQAFLFFLSLQQTGTESWEASYGSVPDPAMCFGRQPFLTAQSSEPVHPGMSMTLDLWADASKTGRHFQTTVTFDPSYSSAAGPYSITNSTGSCTDSAGSFTMHFQSQPPG